MSTPTRPGTWTRLRPDQQAPHYRTPYLQTLAPDLYARWNTERDPAARATLARQLEQAAAADQAQRAAAARARADEELVAIAAPDGSGDDLAPAVTEQIIRWALADTIAAIDADDPAFNPDLHTHAAVSNKVQAPAGSWLAPDGRALTEAAVSAAEHYNTRLEAELTDRLGVAFDERPQHDPPEQIYVELLRLEHAGGAGLLTPPRIRALRAGLVGDLDALATGLPADQQIRELAWTGYQRAAGHDTAYAASKHGVDLAVTAVDPGQVYRIELRDHTVPDAGPDRAAILDTHTVRAASAVAALRAELDHGTLTSPLDPADQAELRGQFDRVAAIARRGDHPRQMVTTDSAARVHLAAGLAIAESWLVENTPDLYEQWVAATPGADRDAVADRIAAADTPAAGRGDPGQPRAAQEPEVGHPIAQPADETQHQQGDPNDRWADLAASAVGHPVTSDPNWATLAATMSRADRTGYPLDQQLPALAAQTPLPDRGRLLELSYRLMHDCPDAIPPPPTPAVINNPPATGRTAQPPQPDAPAPTPRPSPGGPAR